MPIASLMTEPKQQYFSADGSPLSGGKLYTFAAGTSNAKPTYTTAAGTTAQQNPVPLNTRGEPDSPIYWNGVYRVELRDAAGNLIYTVDNYSPPVNGEDLASDGGVTLVGNAVDKRALAQPTGGDSIGFRSTTVGARLAQTISIQDEGGKDDYGSSNATDNAPDYAKITSKYSTGSTIKFPRTQTGVYDFQSYTGGDYNNYAWDVDEGVLLRFPVNAVMGQPQLKALRDVRCYFKDTNTYYTLQKSFSNTLQARFHLNKSQFMGPGDRDTTITSPVDLGAAVVEKFDLPWPDGPLTTNTTITTTARKVTIPLAAGNIGFKGIALPAFPGAEYSWSFETPDGWDGFYLFGALTQNGFDVLYETTVPGTGAARMRKEFGTPAIDSPIKFRGSGNTYSTWAKNGECTVRCLTYNSFEVLVNGVKRYRAWTTNTALRSIFVGAGFGSIAANIGVRDMVLSRNKLTAGQRPMTFMAIGDSITDAQIHGNWPNYMAEALEGTMGIRVQRMINIAVSGAKAIDQYASLLTADISNVDFAVIMIGVNDIQAQTDPDGNFITNLGRILDRFNGQGIPCVVGIPTMFYSRQVASAVTGFAGQGVDAQNYDKGGPYRSRLIYEVASRNPTLNRICFGTLEELGVTIPDFLNDNEGLDTIIYDNIHPTSHARRLVGYSYARTVAGMLAPHTSRAYPRTGIQPGWFVNGWSNTNGSASYEIDEAGTLGLRGFIDKGASIADGTDLFILPPNLRPTTSITLPCIVSGAAFNAIARVLIDNNSGKATVFGAPVGTTGIYLDSIHYKLNW